MLRVLIAIAIAIPLYEALRYAVLKRARESLRRRARQYAEHHDVRVDLFKFGGKELVRKELLNDRAIARAMMDAVERGERDVRDRVEEYIDEIVPAFSLAAYFEFGMKLARAAIGAVYRPLVVRKAPALPENATAVFLINHRSNFDYVVVGWALARQVAISYAVGEWARVFPLDALFKAFGGFFVRRGFPDPLYHTVLRRYLQLITRRGVTQGIFPEGGLTRDGALRAPKVGLLDALIQLTGESELYFVPVASTTTASSRTKRCCASCAPASKRAAFRSHWGASSTRNGRRGRRCARIFRAPGSWRGSKASCSRLRKSRRSSGWGSSGSSSVARSSGRAAACVVGLIDGHAISSRITPA